LLGVLYGLLGLIFTPFLLLFALFGGKAGGPFALFGGVFFALMVPIFYAAMGFISGVIVAAIYNLVAKWTGGLEYQVREVPPSA